MTKEKYTHIHEGALENISSLMFDIEHSMPADHPVRKQIYKARCEIGTAMAMNRENKDWPQERWVPHKASGRSFKVGDKVRWSAKFLRSIGDYSHASATANAVVSELNLHANQDIVRLTDLCGMPGVVNKNNLILVGEIEHD